MALRDVNDLRLYGYIWNFASSIFYHMSPTKWIIKSFTLIIEKFTSPIWIKTNIETNATEHNLEETKIVKRFKLLETKTTNLLSLQHITWYSRLQWWWHKTGASSLYYQWRHFYEKVLIKIITHTLNTILLLITFKKDLDWFTNTLYR
jgi:hypothetical protein